MIKKLWVENTSGNILDIDLRNSGDELGLLIFNIEGLGPPKATVNGSGGPNFDGIRASSVRTDARQLIITLAITAGGTLEENAKQLIYTYFPIKQQINLGIVTDRKDVYIPAIVESNEFNQFAKVENAVISLYCPNPYFIEATSDSVIIPPESVVPLFEFPFENDGLAVDDLEFGYITTYPTAYIQYSGQVKTGVNINLSMSGYVEDVVITNSNGAQQMTLDFTDAETYFGSAVQNGDQVFINTKSGEKSVYFVRGTTFYNMINGVGIDDDWIELLPGTNIIVMTAVSGIDNMETEVEYHILSEGV